MWALTHQVFSKNLIQARPYPEGLKDSMTRDLRKMLVTAGSVPGSCLNINTEPRRKEQGSMVKVTHRKDDFPHLSKEEAAELREVCAYADT